VVISECAVCYRVVDFISISKGGVSTPNNPVVTALAATAAAADDDDHDDVMVFHLTGTIHLRLFELY